MTVASAPPHAHAHAHASALPSQPSESSSSIMARLRHETRSPHDRVEALPYSQAILTGDVTLPRYASQLLAWATFVGALERALDAQADAPILAVWRPEQRKLPWLLADLQALQALGVQGSPVEAASRYAAQLEALAAGPRALGLLGHVYVLEGSALGGMVLRKHLLARFDALHEQAGLRFYSGHGRATMARWAEFKARMDASILTLDAQELVIEEASAAFGAVADILSAL